MSSDKVNQAASVTPPVSGKNTIVVASGTSAAQIQLPADWDGIVTVQADGVKTFFAFGDSAVTVNDAAVTTLDGTSKLPTTHGAGECQMLPADAEAPVNLEEIRRRPGQPIYVAHKESAAGGYFRLIHSSGSVEIA